LFLLAPAFLSWCALAAAGVDDKPASADQPATSKPAAGDRFGELVRPILTNHCIKCHGAKKPKAGVNLAALTDSSSAWKKRKTWSRVRESLEEGLMPPEGHSRPSREEVEALLGWIEVTEETVDCETNVDPGRVTMRRLNRTEYRNTIRDLTGVDFHADEDFPSDDVGYGFDNIGDVLTLPPILLEKYLAAAGTIAEQAVNAKLGGPGPAKVLIRNPKSPAEIQECARLALDRFARRAYRRPVTGGEVAQLLKLFNLAIENGDGFERGIQLAVQAALVSPHFLFRVELLNSGRRYSRDSKSSKTLPIGDYELASRLSYFLWSSMPDDELFELAEDDQLSCPDVLEAQVLRMRKDPKSRAFVENFTGQWLQLRNLKIVNPDRGRFPSFDEPLREAMIRETELFFASVMNEDRSLGDLLDADYTFVNGRLARHYGMEGVNGEEFRRVSIPAGRRGGLITQASILTVTSNPTRTSPVKRGKWILEQILGTPPPPPPPDVPELDSGSNTVLTGSIRQRMEAHRANPNCASCHSRMDPLGFSLEHYDAVGAWRDKDGEFAIDSSGTLPTGQAFQGIEDLKVILKAKQSAFTRCLAEKLLVYAIGRGLEDFDVCAVDNIVKVVAAGDDRLSRLILEIVLSDPFRKRRG
jgi:mono/diheme cytochrome c family protein